MTRMITIAALVAMSLSNATLSAGATDQLRLLAQVSHLQAQNAQQSGESIAPQTGQAKKTARKK